MTQDRRDPLPRGVIDRAIAFWQRGPGDPNERRPRATWRLLRWLSALGLLGPIGWMGFLAMNQFTGRGWAIPTFTLFGLIFFAQYLLFRRARALRKHAKAVNCRICTECGYSLVDLEESGTCPECGSVYTPESLNEIWMRE